MEPVEARVVACSGALELPSPSELATAVRSDFRRNAKIHAQIADFWRQRRDRLLLVGQKCVVEAVELLHLRSDFIDQVHRTIDRHETRFCIGRESRWRRPFSRVEVWHDYASGEFQLDRGHRADELVAGSQLDYRVPQRLHQGLSFLLVSDSWKLDHG